MAFTEGWHGRKLLSVDTELSCSRLLSIHVQKPHKHPGRKTKCCRQVQVWNLTTEKENNQIHYCNGNLGREKMQNVHTENITSLCTLKICSRNTTESRSSSQDGMSDGNMIDAAENFIRVKKEE